MGHIYMLTPDQPPWVAAMLCWALCSSRKSASRFYGIPNHTGSQHWVLRSDGTYALEDGVPIDCLPSGTGGGNLVGVRVEIPPLSK